MIPDLCALSAIGVVMSLWGHEQNEPPAPELIQTFLGVGVILSMV